MATGLSLEAAAAKIGVGARTLFSWQDQHEELRQAIQEGRQRALLFWEEQAISMAKGAPGQCPIGHAGFEEPLPRGFGLA